MENIKKYVYNTVVIVLIAVGAIVVILNFSHFGNVEFTDNARVRQHITPQNTRVHGFIKEVRFEEFQKVKKGDTLYEIAAKNGTTVEKLKKLNKIKGNTINPGKKLRVK